MKYTKLFSSTYQVLVGTSAVERSVGPLTRKLRTFAKLPNGWSHGEGVPVSQDTIRVAETFVNIATQLQLKADVFPGLHGDCAVAFYNGDECVEVIVNGSRDAFDLHVERGHGFEFTTTVAKANADHAEVVAQIARLVPVAWKSLESSLFASLMETDADFRMLYSSTPPESEPELRTVG